MRVEADVRAGSVCGSPPAGTQAKMRVEADVRAGSVCGSPPAGTQAKMRVEADVRAGSVCGSPPAGAQAKMRVPRSTTRPGLDGFAEVSRETTSCFHSLRCAPIADGNPPAVSSRPFRLTGGLTKPSR